MKILHLSKSDGIGGAAIATSRLCYSINSFNIESQILVAHKTSNSKLVLGTNRIISKIIAIIRSQADKIPILIYMNKSNQLWSPFVFPNKKIVRKIISIKPDIINLHWINGGFISINDILSINKKSIPIVWTLHDMRPFTGGCHYSGECIKYQTHCNRCPQLGSNKYKDLSYRIFEKMRLLSKTNIEIITLSKWMKNCVEKSRVFKNKNIHLIPNGINTSLFKPIQKTKIKEKYNLPKNKKIILFGAMNATSDKRKGYSYLKKAIEILPKDFHYAIYGSDGENRANTTYLGKINDEKTMVELYNSADVFVAPSIEDNLPNTLIEATACGIPLVGFNAGGIPDIIEHKKTGYVAKLKDSKDLAKGIQWVIEDKKRNQKLGENARKKALKEYTQELQAKRYIKLYKKILQNS